MQAWRTLQPGDCLPARYFCQVRIASRINFLQGSDVYRTNDLVKTAKEWRNATVSKYVPSPPLGQDSPAPRDAKMRRRRGKTHGDTMTLVGWSDAPNAVGGNTVWGRYWIRAHQSM